MHAIKFCQRCTGFGNYQPALIGPSCNKQIQIGMYYCMYNDSHSLPSGTRNGSRWGEVTPSGCDDEIKDEICRRTLPTLSQRLSNCRGIYVPDSRFDELASSPFARVTYSGGKRFTLSSVSNHTVLRQMGQFGHERSQMRWKQTKSLHASLK